jgi:hypothetical protein
VEHAHGPENQHPPAGPATGPAAGELAVVVASLEARVSALEAEVLALRSGAVGESAEAPEKMGGPDPPRALSTEAP